MTVMLLVIFTVLSPAVYSGPPLSGAYSTDCQGSWDCYWWAKFYNLVNDFMALLYNPAIS